ncbi:MULTISPECIES: helix-turn-helix domain-containing protein [Paraburkholderia]|uniref:helix-turn-helix domain-containing protein n=1 Tax=Paraburkholderia TaxID=1822464 RepID=UPI0008A7F624|nr:helix-turn-helix domain-containing protein [Paraburkholderia hospita]SEI28019.1 Helix-turn-helix domain-containing protein [Paraburkholderia hospita]
MSFHLVNLAWQCDVRAAKKIVLLALADFAQQSTGECAPSVRVLSAKCGLSASAVRTQLHALIADGLVELVIKSGKESFRVKLGAAA